MPEAARLKRGAVVQIGRKRNCVVGSVQLNKNSATVRYLPVVGGEKLSSEGITYLTGQTPEVKGVWKGNIYPGAVGYIIDPQNGEKGEVRQVATATKKRGAKSKSGSASAEKNGSKRASDEELDELAEQVVELRDEEDKSWSEIEEELGIAPGRLRALYNRGGGEPSRKRQGAAAAKKKADKKSGSKKGKGTRRRAAKDDEDDDDE